MGIWTQAAQLQSLTWSEEEQAPMQGDILPFSNLSFEVRSENTMQGHHYHTEEIKKNKYGGGGNGK